MNRSIINEDTAPCPFCGSKNLDIARTWDFGGYMVCCDACDASGPVKPKRTEAVDAWDLRFGSMVPA